jgi:hypothetical protein
MAKDDISLPPPKRKREEAAIDTPFAKTTEKPAPARKTRRKAPAPPDQSTTASPDPADWTSGSSDLVSFRVPVELFDYMRSITGPSLTQTDVIRLALSRLLMIHRDDPQAFRQAVADYTVSRLK